MYSGLVSEDSHKMGRLVICPTPLGNLDDVTLRVLRELQEADVVACEDTRHSRKLLARHGIKAKLVSYHEHNEKRRAPYLVERIKQGQLVALVTDAGMPAISDPGAVLIGRCIEANLTVEVLPGPSAVTTALVASGIDAETWKFVGFLPRKQGALRQLLAEQGEETIVCFESPNRLKRTLSVLAEDDPERRVAVCRELTKIHEEVVRGTLKEVAKEFSERSEIKGEVVLVISGSPTDEAKGASMTICVGAVKDLVDSGAKPRGAAKVVAKLAGPGVSANSIYKAWLKQK